MRIYLASRYSRLDELQAVRRELHSMGHVVTSRWLNGEHQAENDRLEPGAEAERFAYEDLKDVLRAELVISFTEKPRTTSSRGGRHVEFGVALGRGIPVWIIGPRENVFHCISDVHQFGSFEQAKAALEVVEVV